MRLSSLPFIQTYRQIAPRVTIHLVTFFFLILGLFLQAYIHNFNIVYITLFVILGLAFSSCYFGRMNLKPITLKTLPQGRVFANRDCVLHWSIHNGADNPAYDVTFTCNTEERHFERIEHDALLHLSQRFNTRGTHQTEIVTLESGFPLPHLRFYRKMGGEQTLNVYPEPRGITLEHYLNVHPDIIGERDDFEGLRRYEEGDMPSLIHWPSLAKTGELSSRQFSHRHLGDTLHFDFKSCADTDEARLSQLCLWVLECEKNGFAFTIALPHQLLEHPKESIDAILLTLAKF